MKLDQFLNRHKCPIVLLIFDSKGETEIYQFTKQENINREIPNVFLNMIVMDSKYEEDGVLEIWIK